MCRALLVYETLRECVPYAEMGGTQRAILKIHVKYNTISRHMQTIYYRKRKKTGKTAEPADAGSVFVWVHTQGKSPVKTSAAGPVMKQ